MAGRRQRPLRQYLISSRERARSPTPWVAARDYQPEAEELLDSGGLVEVGVVGGPGVGDGASAYTGGTQRGWAPPASARGRVTPAAGRWSTASPAEAAQALFGGGATKNRRCGPTAAADVSIVNDANELP